MILTLGGPPVVRTFTVDAAGAFNGAAAPGDGEYREKWVLPASSVWLTITATTLPARFYWSKKDFDADADYLEVDADETVGFPGEIREFWARGVGGTSTVRLIVACKA